MAFPSTLNVTDLALAERIGDQTGTTAEGAKSLCASALRASVVPVLLATWPSAEPFAKQHGLSIEIRRSKSHDRPVFIDGTDCCHSSASFQDGGGKSAAMLSQVTDAFDSTKQIYEIEWGAAVVVRAA